MDIRKHIIILCLLCCHALCVMADGQIVRNYVPISEQETKDLFRNLDPRIRVTGVSYGDYERVGENKMFASPKTSKDHCFALKVECDEHSSFSFRIQELRVGKNGIYEFYYYDYTYKQTVIVDGHAMVLPKRRYNNKYQYKKCELSPGEHEIVIMSNHQVSSTDPRPLQITYMDFCAHRLETKDQKLASCGQDGYIKRECKWCPSILIDSLPMPAAKHEIDRERKYQSSCLIPSSWSRKCNHCSLFEFKIDKRSALEHNFQNGRCVNDSCNIKLPTQNAAGIYQVGDAYELRGLSELIATGAIPRDCNIDLTADITYPEDLAHLPIGTTAYPFAGTFDGHGHRIAGMQSALPADMIGLFGVVEGTPRRLAVIANVIIDASTKLNGISMIGAVAGRADYCDIMRCVSRATVFGNTNVGGIVGYSERECHLIDCAGQGIVNSLQENGGTLSGTLRRGYIMDSYSSGSLATEGAVSVLVPTTADSPLRHCFQLDAKAPMACVTSFSSAQLSDGTLARMLCEKNGKDMPAHWQQGAKDGCPMPVFTALADRPASVIQPQGTRAELSALAMNSYFDEEDEEEEFDDEHDEEGEEDFEDEDVEWESLSSESNILGGSPEEEFIFYDEADSTLHDFTCYVTTTYRNVPAMPMFSVMLGGDATECNVIYEKKDSTVILEYNYTMDGRRYILTDATKQYTTPDSLVHVERYDVEGNDEGEGEFLMTNNMVYGPDNSGYEEKVSHGVATRVMDWEVTQADGKEPTQNYYLYDEEGQERVDVYSISLSENDSDKTDEGDDLQLPVEMEYTQDENGWLIDLHYLLTDPITGEKYVIGGEYYIYDELGEQVQVVSYEPVEPHSHEMRQTEYCTIEVYNADHPSAIIPIEQLQPGTLDGSSTRTSTHVYDMRGNLVRLSNDPAALKSLPKGIYITRGKKILVR